MVSDLLAVSGYKRGKKAFWLGVFTFGIGGYFYVGKWYGISGGIGMALLQIINFFLIFTLTGFLTFPLCWAFGAFGGWWLTRYVNREVEYREMRARVNRIEDQQLASEH